MQIKRQTPIYTVAAIEPLLPFWTDGLGYTKLAEVPHEGALGFVMLEKDGAMVMLQSEASVRADLGEGSPLRAGSVALYLDVDSIEAAVQTVERSGAQVFVPLRTTFYGAKEIWILTPDGQVVGFAEHAES